VSHPNTASDRDWVVEIRGEAIWVIFGKAVDAASGAASARRFVEVLGARSMHLVFDTRTVAAYGGARKAWQNVIWPHRAQIKSLSVISASKLTRMGATMFGAFVGIDSTVVHTPEELPAHLR